MQIKEKLFRFIFMSLILLRTLPRLFKKGPKRWGYTGCQKRGNHRWRGQMPEEGKPRKSICIDCHSLLTEYSDGKTKIKYS